MRIKIIIKIEKNKYMDNVKPGLSFTEEKEPTGSSYNAPLGGAEVVSSGGKAGVKTAGKVSLGPEQTEDILANMQALINKRTGPMNTFLGGLQEASAWGAGGEQGPSAALTAVRRQRQLEEADTLGMQEKMAAFRASQAQTAAQRESTGKFLDTLTPGGGEGGAGGLPTGLDPNILNRVKQLSLGSAEDREIANKLLNAHLADVGKIKSQAAYSPTTYEKKIEVELPNGEIGFISLEAVLAGQGKPTAKGAAQVKVAQEEIKNAPTSATAGRGNAVEIAAKLNIPLISGDRDWDKQYNLYIESKKPGYKGNPVAFPGTSKHEKGYAIDVGPINEKQRQDLIAAGFKQTLPQKDPNHWELQVAPAVPVPKPSGTAAPTPTEVKKPVPAEVAPTKSVEIPVARAEIAAQPQSGVIDRNKPISAAARNQADIEKALAIEGGQSNIKMLEDNGKVFITRTDPVLLAERSGDVKQIQTLVDKYGNDPTIAGIFNDKGITNAIAVAIRDGIQTPGGPISAPAITAVMQRLDPNASPEKLEAAQEIARLMGKRLMDVVAKSKGSTSDKDMVAFKQIAGSADSGWNVINKLNNYDRLAIETDRQDRQLFNGTYNGKTFDYAKHTINPKRVELYEDHYKKADEIIKSKLQTLKTPNRPAGVPKGSEYNPKTNQWRHKDKSGNMVITNG
jgi:hypothetical protein